MSMEHAPQRADGGSSNWVQFAANLLLLFVSTVLSALFIGQTMGADDFSAVDGVITVGMGMALFALLVAMQHYGLRIIPNLPSKQKTQAAAAWFALALPIALLSGGTSLMYAGTPMAKNLQFQESTEFAIEQVYRPKADVAKEIGLLAPAVQTYATTAETSAKLERTRGVFTGYPGTGATYTELTNLHNVFRNLNGELVKARAETKALVNRGDDILEEIRTVKDARAKTWHEKTEAIRKLVLELNVISESLDEQMPIASLKSAVEATEKDWLALGLNEGASSKMQYTFAPMGVRLNEELSRYKRVNRIEIAPFENMSGMALIGRFAGKLFPLIIFCVMLEVLPIAGVAMALLTSTRADSSTQTMTSSQTVPSPNPLTLDPQQLAEIRQSLFAIDGGNKG